MFEFDASYDSCNECHTSGHTRLAACCVCVSGRHELHKRSTPAYVSRVVGHVVAAANDPAIPHHNTPADATKLAAAV